MTTTLYGIVNCDTVKKTKKLLEANNIDYQFYDFKKNAPTQEMIKRWLKVFGSEKLINKRGTTWRKLDEKHQVLAEGNEKQQINLLIDNSSMIKRPIIESGKNNIIGFDKNAIENL
jgi:Spx/MgsR family transcriptional regulator